MAAAGSNRRIRTGLYDIDLACPELRKAGVRVPLQEQPFRVLSLLLERPGEVVTREELQTRLWPADTYVGFDEGINTAIRKLRSAFGDSAENPRFIETLPRRGYRFIAPVNEMPRPGLAIGEDSTLKMGNTVTVGVIDARPQEQNGRHTSIESAARPRSWKLIAGAVFSLLLISSVIVYFVRGRRPTAVVPAKRVMLAILPFPNMSNDPTQEYFGDGLTEETITDLGELSPEHLGVIARTSAMAYKRTDKTVSQIGRELGLSVDSVKGRLKRARLKLRALRDKPLDGAE